MYGKEEGSCSSRDWVVLIKDRFNGLEEVTFVLRVMWELKERVRDAVREELCSRKKKGLILRVESGEWSVCERIAGGWRKEDWRKKWNVGESNRRAEGGRGLQYERLKFKIWLNPPIASSDSSLECWPPMQKCCLLVHLSVPSRFLKQRPYTSAQPNLSIDFWSHRVFIYSGVWPLKCCQGSISNKSKCRFCKNSTFDLSRKSATISLPRHHSKPPLPFSRSLPIYCEWWNSGDYPSDRSAHKCSPYYSSIRTARYQDTI